jgi:hypothetical protein
MRDAHALGGRSGSGGRGGSVAYPDPRRVTRSHDRAGQLRGKPRHTNLLWLVAQPDCAAAPAAPAAPAAASHGTPLSAQ